MDAVYAPLLVTVRGPADESDFALVYVVEALEGNSRGIARELQSFDYDAFKSVVPSVETNGPDAIDAAEGAAGLTTSVETTFHTVQLDAAGVPGGYAPSAEDKASILRYMKDLLETELDQSFELVAQWETC